MNDRVSNALLACAVISFAMLVLVEACATAPTQTDWIRIGMTTRDQVVERFGPPDLVIGAPDGETAIYRPTDPGRSSPRLEIPTAQAGPFGTATTRTQSIDPGLGAKELNTRSGARPSRETRIRYDARGIVQEFMQ